MVQHAAKTVNIMDSTIKRQSDIVAKNYRIPGPFEPYPGRSNNGDYLPLFPFHNQYSMGFDYDPSTARHIGGDINVPIPSWGILDINGHQFNRIRDTVAKVGYMAHPVNMMGFDKNDYIKLVSNPSLLHNREIQPEVPLGVVPRRYAPLSCKAPFCNPYTSTFMFGAEYDYGGHDGNDGVIDVPIPVSKDTAYRFPFGGMYYYALDNITVTYGQHLSPIDPYSSYLFPENRIGAFEKFNQVHGGRAKRYTSNQIDHKPIYETKWAPEYVEIPILYKSPYPWMKPIYITSIKKPINKKVSKLRELSTYDLKKLLQKQRHSRNYNNNNNIKWRQIYKLAN
uniref:Uncharacterized protein n=1 Tax=Parastrongyloides trichosuri TaxID=131310 RepID=A0A0N4ZDY5_PARTI